MSTGDDKLIFLRYGQSMITLRPTRRRDAAATRQAILDAARILFARDSYENVGIREIASKAGVDGALVSRYFGSKEELFSQVLCSGRDGMDVIGSELEGLPDRVAKLLIEPEEAKSMDDMLIFMHSATSPTAGPLVRASIHERFVGPFAEVIGGQNALIRSRLFGAILLGVSITQHLHGDEDVSDDQRDKLEKRLADLVAAAIAPL